MTAAAKLLRWYEKNGRDLPWRHTRDPYRILVSEIMLQQTQVSRGLIFYERWLKRFPNWQSLARASNGQVIRAWAGLGYNRRALMLRDISRKIVANKLPANESEWMALKGIGPYTSSAIAAFALHQRTLPIDTNIRRVLGRLLLGVPYPEPKHDDLIRQRAEAFLPRRGRFFDVPQALFDLATAICTKTPSCSACPMQQNCLAANKFLSGRVKTPKATIKKPIERRHRDKPYPDRIYRGRILSLVRRHRNGVPVSTIGPAVDPTFDPGQDREWMDAMLGRLQADAMIRIRSGHAKLA